MLYGLYRQIRGNWDLADKVEASSRNEAVKKITLLIGRPLRGMEKVKAIETECKSNA